MPNALLDIIRCVVGKFHSALAAKHNFKTISESDADGRTKLVDG